MTLERFKSLNQDEKIEYMKDQIAIKDRIDMQSWQWSLAHALDFYNRSFVKHSAELSIIFDDLKNNFVNV